MLPTSKTRRTLRALGVEQTPKQYPDDPIPDIPIIEFCKAYQEPFDYSIREFPPEHYWNIFGDPES